MISHEPRSLGYYAASHWLQGAVVFTVLGALAIGLLLALGDAQVRAEKQVVDLTIRNMRTGMQFAMGEALMQQREREIASWVGSNPVRWLDPPPAGYRGECSVAGRQNMSGGEWCFERDSRELYYRPRNGNSLRTASESIGHECIELSWRVVQVPEVTVNVGFAGLRIEARPPCKWVQD